MNFGDDDRVRKRIARGYLPNRAGQEAAKRDEMREEIADLKRKLSDSIAREQEIERELTDCHQQRCKLRAHADALAGALESYPYDDHIRHDLFEPVLTAYRNREESE